MADEPSLLRIIAFEKDAHPLMGIYRPIYRRGDRVYRVESESHDREWLATGAKSGRIAPLEHPIPSLPRNPLILCLPKANKEVLDFLPLQHLEKLGAVAACLDVSRCHETIWRSVRRVHVPDSEVAKWLYAMMFACHVLRHGANERFEVLTTTIYLHPLREQHEALDEVWTLAKRFLLRFDKSLPDHPSLTTERTSLFPA